MTRSSRATSRRCSPIILPRSRPVSSATVKNNRHRGEHSFRNRAIWAGLSAVPRPPTPLLAALAWSARRVDGEQPGVLREREHRVHVSADLGHSLIAQALGTLAAEQRLDHLRLAVVHADRTERRHHVPVERALVVRGGARLEVRLYVLSQPLPAKLEHRHRARDVAALVDGGLKLS